MSERVRFWRWYRTVPIFSMAVVAALCLGVVSVPSVLLRHFLFPVHGIRGALGFDVSPALLGVGYIVGTKVSTLLFGGTLFGWLVLLPILAVAIPGAGSAWDVQSAQHIWKHYVHPVQYSVSYHSEGYSLQKHDPGKRFFPEPLQSEVRRVSPGLLSDPGMPERRSVCYQTWHWVPVIPGSFFSAAPFLLFLLHRKGFWFP